MKRTISTGEILIKSKSKRKDIEKKRLKQNIEGTYWRHFGEENY